MKIVSIAPFSNYWKLHGLWESTTINALRLRGHECVQYLCDGLFPVCDLHFDWTDPRRENTCQECQAISSGLAAGMHIPFRNMGRVLDRADFEEARRISRDAPRESLVDLVHGDWKLGEWCGSSVRMHFRASELDLEIPGRQEIFRKYLETTYLACVATERILAEEKPDALWVFNARMSAMRATLEIARSMGIRTIVHERGIVPEALNVTVDANCLSISDIPQAWTRWKDVPLTAEEFTTIVGTMSGRERGSGIAWTQFSPPPQSPDQVLRSLRLDPRLPILSLFTSSDDEVVLDPGLKGVHARQIDWVAASAAYMEKHPELQLVIRVHPNTGGKKALGANVAQLEQMTELGRRLPKNVRMVMPDDPISTYTLIDLSTLGLVYQSTVAIELACKGKPVILGAGNWAEAGPFAFKLESPESYHDLIDKILADASLSEKPIRRAAYRFAHLLFHKRPIPFPLVRMPDPHTGELAYDRLDALQPGRDPHLDRLCRIITEGESVCLPPTPERARLSGIEEERLLESLMKGGALPPAAARSPSPRVSVIVPCYNYGPYLRAAVDSVLGQSWKDLEIVIVNDGSTDDSLQVAKSLEKDHPGIVRVLDQPNSGQPAISRNNGIAASRGEIIVPLDADDEFEPSYIEEAVRAIDSGYDVAFPDVLARLPDGTTRVDRAGHFEIERLVMANQLPYCSAYRRTVWESTGGYRTNVRGYEDWDFWIGAAARKFRGLGLRKPLLRYLEKADGIFLSDALGKHAAHRRAMAANHPEAFGPGRPGANSLVHEASGLLERAQKLVEAGRIGEAIGSARIAAQLAPGIGADQILPKLEALALRGQTASTTSSRLLAIIDEANRKLLAGDIDAALRTMSEAGPEGDSSKRFVFAKAWLLVQAGRESLAQVEYVKATRAWPDDPETHANLAGLRLKTGRVEQAEASLRTVLELRPHDPDALLALARTRRTLGDPGTSDRLYGELLQHHPDHPGAEESKTVLDEASPEDMMTRLEGFLERGEIQQALEYSRTMVETHPQNASAWLGRAILLRGAGSADALLAVQEAIRLGGGPDSLFESVLIQMENGLRAEAGSQWESLSRDHASWLDRRRELHASEGLSWPGDTLERRKFPEANRT